MGRIIFNVSLAIAVVFSLVGFGWLYAYADGTAKYDGDCNPLATVGRCADKCPAPTSEGTYYLQGYDKETGVAVCGFSYYHACPLADAQPADGAVCKRLEAQQSTSTTPAQPPQDVDMPASPAAIGFAGK